MGNELAKALETIMAPGFGKPGLLERPSAPPEEPLSRELVKEIAMDIGKEIAAYIEVMYPKAVEATSSTFLLSVRNSIYNEIMAAIDVNDAGQIRARIKTRKKFRRDWKAAWRKIRENEKNDDATRGEHSAND